MNNFLNRKISLPLAVLVIIVLSSFFGFLIVGEFQKLMDIKKGMIETY